MTSPPPPPKGPRKPGNSPGSNHGQNSQNNRQNASKTILGSLTQAFQTVANVDFGKIPLKPNARVPKLVVETGDRPSEYPLVGEHYILGRSSKSCDIVVRSPIVSQTHLSLTRDTSRPGNPFVLKDQGSTNGIYRKKKRLSKLPLRHGDVLTLGPQELADAVTVRYVDPPPWYVKAMRYGILGTSGLTGLIALWIVLIEWPKIPINPLPESVQGPVLVTAEGEDGSRTPLNELPNIVHRENQRLQEYSPYLPAALVASEDTRFYWHPGVDPIGIVRALKTNVEAGEIAEGASTLGQQMARNMYRGYVGTEDTNQRKIREIIVALKLETFYSKDAIMLLYLNRVYLGNNLYGFEDASQFYFDKPASDLSIEEAATLVGILPAPNAFNPVQDPDAAIQFRNRVIQRMAASGAISNEEAENARRSIIRISPKAREQLRSARAPYFYSYVYEELDSILGVDLTNEGNFVVETSLNLERQQQAEQALRNTVANQGAQAGYDQGAVVTLNTQNGEIEALVGGFDFAESQYNRVSQAYRQPGSTFKIFAYAAAIEQGVSPSETFGCSDLTWEGQTFAGCRSGGGALDMYAGLARSENVVALRIAQAVGLGSVIEMAERMGITAELQARPGLVLGQSEVTPLEITGAFGALANEGVWNKPHGIRRIIDSGSCEDNANLTGCRVIYDFETDGESNIPAVEPWVANTMVSMMQGVVQGGTGRNAFLGRGEAGKTGTTNDNVDMWFIGYVPRDAVVTGVWLGNDDPTPTGGSSAQAAQLWGSYMGRALN
ncbi:MAG: transglycosylase domain-containing protein [Cyanobacteria bacterium J06643_4]